MLRALVIAASLLIAACTHTNTKLADAKAPKPPAGSKILIVQPDIELTMLTVSGLKEPRADWTQAGRDNMAAQLTSAMQNRAHTFTMLDPSTAMEGRNGQLLRLHEVVGFSILQYGGLPTKKNSFDWTLGEGARSLGETYGADYALFTYGRGSYSSGGRKAMMVASALVGVSMPMATQQVFSSLVDLKTGRVVWFNVAVPSAVTDMRNPEGAAELTKSMLKDVPL